MSAYRSVGAYDDQILEDGDRGFVGVNQRLQLNQLESGEVRESVNGRMEGYWKPRRAVLDRSGALTTGGAPLQLPFFLIDVAKTISDVSVPVTGTVEIEVTGHGFGGVGVQGYANVVGLDSAVNGRQLLTVVDANNLSFSVPGYAVAVDTSGTLEQTPISDAANADVRASCLFSDPNSDNKEYVIVALDTVAKKIDLETYAVTDIAYPKNATLSEKTDMIQVFDEVILFRDGQQSFEWFPNGRGIVSASQSSTTVTMKLTRHGLSVGDTIVVSGLTGGTPANGTFVVATVTDEDIFTFSNTQLQITGTLSPDVTGIYEVGEGTINSRTYWKSPTLIQTGPATISGSNPEFSGAGTLIYYDGFGTRWIIKNRTTTAASTSFSRSWTSNTTSGFDIFAATGWAPVGLATGTPTLSPISQTQTFVTSSATLTAGFTFSPAGDYTQPQTFSVASSDVDVVDGVVTTTVSGNTTIQAGDLITVYECTIPLLTSLVGQEFIVKTATATTVEFFAPVANFTAGGSDKIEFGRRFSVGAGFIHQPGAPWGTYFQRRLWVPFYYAPAGTFSSPTYTSRKITDEIAVSDILDNNTFDQIENQFRISGGSADHLVAMHGFYDDGLVVLNRNSLHLISGTQGSLRDTVVKELTSEVGCLARKSVVIRGNVMLFLSDDGVYGLEFLNDYNLRGTEEPLSKNVQPYIDRINKGLASNAVGVLYENRYYLAVPLDSSVGANDARGNNAILVFNFLNKGWESLDTFGSSEFLIEDFIIGTGDERNDIYVVTSNGGLHQMEASESENDRFNISNFGGNVVSVPISAKLVTRGYDFKTLDRKRYTDAQINMQTLPNELGEYDIAFSAEDPDNSVSIGTTSLFLGGEILSPSTTGEAETASIRCRLAGIRGSVGTMTLTRTVGSPKINSVRVAASITNRQIISQK